MTTQSKPKKDSEFRCMECGAGTVRPFAAAGREAKFRTLTLPVPARLKIPTCDHCGTEWINDTTAEALDQALDKEYRARMRDLIDATMTRISESNVPKSEIEKALGLSQGYLSHLTGDKTPSVALASELVFIAQNPRKRIQDLENLWKKLSGPNPDPVGALAQLSR